MDFPRTPCFDQFDMFDSQHFTRNPWISCRIIYSVLLTFVHLFDCLKLLHLDTFLFVRNIPRRHWSTPSIAGSEFLSCVSITSSHDSVVAMPAHQKRTLMTFPVFSWREMASQTGVPTGAPTKLANFKHSPNCKPGLYIVSRQGRVAFRRKYQQLKHCRCKISFTGIRLFQFLT